MKDLDGWTFTVDEVSMGVYEATGVDAAGHKVQRKGTDTDELLRDVREDARELQRELGRLPF